MQEKCSILLSKVVIIRISLNSKHISHFPSNLFSIFYNNEFPYMLCYSLKTCNNVYEWNLSENLTLNIPSNYQWNAAGKSQIYPFFFFFFFADWIFGWWIGYLGCSVLWTVKDIGVSMMFWAKPFTRTIKPMRNNDYCFTLTLLDTAEHTDCKQLKLAKEKHT